MAKALLVQEIARRGLQDAVKVDSAGVFAVIGAPASQGSVVAMSERGLDISDHRGKQLASSHVQEADILLVMEESQRRVIFNHWPRALSKTFLFSEMVGEGKDVADPYGQDQAAYDQTARLLESIVQRGMPQILRHLELESPSHPSKAAPETDKRVDADERGELLTPRKKKSPL